MPRAQPPRDLHARTRVIAFGTLSEIVEQRGHHEQIGAVDDVLA